MTSKANPPQDPIKRAKQLMAKGSTRQRAIKTVQKELAYEHQLKLAEELLRQAGYVPDPKGGDGWVKASEIAKPKPR